MALLSDAIMRGLLASRPASDANKAGRLYFATDEETLYRDSGSGWESVEGGADAADILAAKAIMVSFNGNADAYIVAHEAMTIGSATARGVGTIAYAKSTDATDGTAGTFSGATLPVTLAVGDVLKVTVSSLTTYKTVTLERTA